MQRQKLWDLILITAGSSASFRGAEPSCGRSDDQEQFSSRRPLLDWLEYHGFTVVTKPKREFLEASGRRKVKASMVVELAVNAMSLASQLDEIVLFTGDGDFRRLVESVQRRGVRVTVVSTTATQLVMIADELRRQADVFIDLMELGDRATRSNPVRAVR